MSQSLEEENKNPVGCSESGGLMRRTSQSPSKGVLYTSDTVYKKTKIPRSHNTSSEKTMVTSGKASVRPEKPLLETINRERKLIKDLGSSSVQFVGASISVKRLSMKEYRSTVKKQAFMEMVSQEQLATEQGNAQETGILDHSQQSPRTSISEDVLEYTVSDKDLHLQSDVSASPNVSSNVTPTDRRSPEDMFFTPMADRTYEKSERSYHTPNESDSDLLAKTIAKIDVTLEKVAEEEKTDLLDSSWKSPQKKSHVDHYLPEFHTTRQSMPMLTRAAQQDFSLPGSVPYEPSTSERAEFSISSPDMCQLDETQEESLRLDNSKLSQSTPFEPTVARLTSEIKYSKEAEHVEAYLDDLAENVPILPHLPASTPSQETLPEKQPPAAQFGEDKDILEDSIAPQDKSLGQLLDDIELVDASLISYCPQPPRTRRIQLANNNSFSSSPRVKTPVIVHPHPKADAIQTTRRSVREVLDYCSDTIKKLEWVLLQKKFVYDKLGMKPAEQDTNSSAIQQYCQLKLNFVKMLQTAGNTTLEAAKQLRSSLVSEVTTANQEIFFLSRFVETRRGSKSSSQSEAPVPQVDKPAGVIKDEISEKLSQAIQTNEVVRPLLVDSASSPRPHSLCDAGTMPQTPRELEQSAGDCSMPSQQQQPKRIGAGKEPEVIDKQQQQLFQRSFDDSMETLLTDDRKGLPLDQGFNVNTDPKEESINNMTNVTEMTNLSSLPSPSSERTTVVNRSYGEADDISNTNVSLDGIEEARHLATDFSRLSLSHHRTLDRSQQQQQQQQTTTTTATTNSRETTDKLGQSSGEASDDVMDDLSSSLSSVSTARDSMSGQNIDRQESPAESNTTLEEDPEELVNKTFNVKATPEVPKLNLSECHDQSLPNSDRSFQSPRKTPVERFTTVSPNVRAVSPAELRSPFSLSERSRANTSINDSANDSSKLETTPKTTEETQSAGPSKAQDVAKPAISTMFMDDSMDDSGFLLPILKQNVEKRKQQQQPETSTSAPSPVSQDDSLNDSGFLIPKKRTVDGTKNDNHLNDTPISSPPLVQKAPEVDEATKALKLCRSTTWIVEQIDKLAPIAWKLYDEHGYMPYYDLVDDLEKLEALLPSIVDSQDEEAQIIFDDERMTIFLNVMKTAMRLWPDAKSKETLVPVHSETEPSKMTLEQFQELCEREYLHTKIDTFAKYSREFQKKDEAELAAILLGRDDAYKTHLELYNMCKQQQNKLIDEITNEYEEEVTQDITTNSDNPVNLAISFELGPGRRLTLNEFSFNSINDSKENRRESLTKRYSSPLPFKPAE